MAGWACSVCKHPLAEGSGMIEIINANPELGPVGSHPVQAEAEFGDTDVPDGIVNMTQLNEQIINA